MTSIVVGSLYHDNECSHNRESSEIHTSSSEVAVLRTNCHGKKGDWRNIREMGGDEVTRPGTNVDQAVRATEVQPSPSRGFSVRCAIDKLTADKGSTPITHPLEPLCFPSILDLVLVRIRADAVNVIPC